jgi:hypothetical protein
LLKCAVGVRFEKSLVIVEKADAGEAIDGVKHQRYSSPVEADGWFLSDFSTRPVLNGFSGKAASKIAK